jgi:arsenical pump membrane protein
MSCLFLAGTVQPQDLLTSIAVLWQPLLTILAIMITTAAAARIGVIDVVAQRVLGPRAASVPSLFRAVFVLGLLTASLLSNDAAILLLTPIVLTFIRRRYPDRPRLLVPFAFAVFMAAGVAPFVTSNPMNMVVASYAGLNFNAYAAIMLPISLAGSIVSYLVLARLFAADLATPARAIDAVPVAPLRANQRRMLLLLAAVTATYPFVAVFDGAAIWAVALSGALVALWLTWRDVQASPLRILSRGVSWDVLIFLPAVFVLATGLRNVGLVDAVALWYRDAGVGVIGLTSAVGSAVLNNHPMALVNMLALEEHTGVVPFLAALVGGDLGPRLLPTGSLAGLLWLESCRRLGVAVSAASFAGVGVLLTIPALLVSLMLLALF